jgi:hypothetical protein
MATRRASLHHLDLAAHPGSGTLDRLARSRVPGLGRLEQAKDVFCARGSPQGEETVIRICESSTTADRHEARVPDLGEDHDLHSLLTQPDFAMDPFQRSASAA